MTTTTRKAFLTVCLASILIYTGLPLRSLADGYIETSDTNIELGELGIRPQSLAFLRDGRTVLLVSSQQPLVLFDVFESSIVRVFADPWLEDVSFSDVAVDPNSQYVLLVGTWSFQKGLLARLDLNSWELRAIRFEDEFRDPSVAVSERGRIFIGDLNSNTITVLENYMFDTLDGETISRYRLQRNIFLKRGAAADLGVSKDGRFIVVSHARDTVLSLVDSEVAEAVDHMGPDERRRYPISMVVTHPSDQGLTKGSATAVVLAEIEDDVLVTAYVDHEFQSFRQGEFAKLELEASSHSDNERSPLMVSASDNLETIVVGSRNDARALFRSPVVARVADLHCPPEDIAVSPDGNTVAILDANDATLRVIRNPEDWAYQSGATPGSDRIREAQRLLSDLGYQVGEVDGVNGPTTRRAVGLFQESADLEPSGTVHGETLERIRSVASELGTGVSRADSLEVAAWPCVPVEKDLRCFSRFGEGILTTAYAGPTTEQEMCSTPEGAPWPVQIDTYKVTREELQYQCTSYHSCPFIRFRELLAYYEICAPRAE